MRKITITVIAITLILGCVGDAHGQMGEWVYWDSFLHMNATRERVSISENLPNLQSFVGGHAKVSATNLWRFNIFFKLGQSIGMTSGGFDIDYVMESNEGGFPFMRPEDEWRLREEISMSTAGEIRQRVSTMTIGVDFRVINNNYIRFSADLVNSLTANSIYAGLLRRQQIAQGTWIDIALGYTQGRRMVGGTGVRVSPQTGETIGTNFNKAFDFQAVQAGLQLRQRIIDNLYLAAGVFFKNKFEINNQDRVTNVLEDFRPETSLPRDQIVLPEVGVVKKTLSFSVGVHKVFPIRPSAPTMNFQNNQRRRATFQAMPCPPNQMRHGRSWDRPSSVFNHPTGR